MVAIYASARAQVKSLAQMAVTFDIERMRTASTRKRSLTLANINAIHDDRPTQAAERALYNLEP